MENGEEAGEQGAESREKIPPLCTLPPAPLPLVPNPLFQQIVDNLLKNHLYLSVHFNS